MRLQSAALEETKDVFIRRFDGFFLAVGNGFGVDGITVMVV